MVVVDVDEFQPLLSHKDMNFTRITYWLSPISLLTLTGLPPLARSAKCETVIMGMLISR